MGPNTAWDLKTNSRGTQTDLVTDRNIVECLMELKSTPEFQGLTYKVGQTCNNEVTLMVTRTDSIGLLGIPLDPVTIIVTSAGLCYFYALFAPVEVTDLKPNGHFAIRLFRNVLRKLNGRAGYGFCPGFKEEDFPQKFKFHKHGFEILRHPFTRIQAKACPVFYQQRRARPGGQNLGSELCSRCLQVGMGVCETLKDSGADGEVPGLVKTLTKVGRRSPTPESARFSSGRNNNQMPSDDNENDTGASASASDDGTPSTPKFKQKTGQNASSKHATHSSFGLDATSPPASSFRMPSSTIVSASYSSHVKQTSIVPAARIKPFRTIAPQERETSDSAGVVGPLVQNTEMVEHGPLILRLKLDRSMSDEVDPPAQEAEVTQSPPPSPQQLLIDEDADPEGLETAVSAEPETKRPCLRCLVCSEAFSLQADLNIHLQRQHRGESAAPVPLSIADASELLDPEPQVAGPSPQAPEGSPVQRSANLESVQASRVTASPPPPRSKTCPVCKQKFVSKEELEIHLKERHHTRLHPCRYCGQKFALKSNLSTHMQSHMGSAHLKCQECGARFSKKKKYAEHIREHMGSLPYFCKICTKLFSRERTFEEHMERHKTRRGVKSLAGAERTTQGIMDRARRCLEDRTQMSLPLMNEMQSLPSSSAVCEDPDNSSRNLSLGKKHEPSPVEPSGESKQSLCPSSNLDLLSAVSLAQAKLDQAFTAGNTQQASGVAVSEGETPVSEAPGTEMGVHDMQATVPVKDPDSQQALHSAALAEPGKGMQTLQEVANMATHILRDSPAPVLESISQSHSPCTAPGHTAEESVRSEEDKDTSDLAAEKKNLSSSVLLQRLSAPLDSSLAATSSLPSESASASASTSTGTSPSRSQNSPAPTQTGGHFDDNKQATSEGKKDVLKQLEERERRVLQKERELREREETITKKNMLLFQQLLLAQLSQQPRIPGSNQAPTTGSTSVVKGEEPPAGMPGVFGVLRGLAPVAGQMFRAPVPVSVGGPRPSLPPTHRFPVSGVLVSAVQAGLRTHLAQQQVVQAGDPLTARPPRPVMPGSEGSTPKRRRPRTTPTPPPLDSPAQFAAPARGSAPTPAHPPVPTLTSAPSTSLANQISASSSGSQSSMLGGSSLLQQLMKLQSKMPETAKQFLPSSKGKPKTVMRPPVSSSATLQPYVPNPVLMSSASSKNASSKIRGHHPAGLPATVLSDGSTEVKMDDRSQQGQWSGGSLMGKDKDKLRSPMMIVPPSEMQRLMSLTKPVTPAVSPPVSAASPSCRPLAVSQHGTQRDPSPSLGHPHRSSRTSPQKPATAQSPVPVTTMTMTACASALSPAAQPSQPPPPPLHIVATSPVAVPPVKLISQLRSPSPARLQSSTAYVPPPLCVPNAAGGLPVVMTSSDGDEMAPIDLTKPNNTQPSAGKSASDQGKTKGRDGPMDLSPVQSALLRRYLLDSNHRVGGMQSRAAEKGDAVSSLNLALQLPHSSPPAPMHPQSFRSPPVLVTQASSTPRTQGTTSQIHSSSSLVPASVQQVSTSPQISFQVPVRGPLSPPVSLPSHASPRPQPQQSSLQQISTSQTAARLTDRMPSPRIVLSRIDEVGKPNDMLVDIPASRYVLPSQTVSSSRGQVSLQHIISPPDVRSQINPELPQRMTSPSSSVLSSPQKAPSTTPPNFLLHTTQSVDASKQSEAVSSGKSVPLGGFLWHRPAAIDPVYGPQSRDRQETGVNTGVLQTERPGTSAFVDGQTDENVDEQTQLSHPSRNAWQEQFLQTLQKQRRHREMLQLQKQQILEARQQQQQQQQQIQNQPQQAQPPQPPGKRGRARKKHVASPTAAAATGNYQEDAGSGVLATASGSEMLLDMPVLPTEQPARRPRKRQARKRKTTQWLDAQDVGAEDKNGEEEHQAGETELQEEPLEDSLNCDACGKVFHSEADILHHECGGDPQ